MDVAPTRGSIAAGAMATFAARANDLGQIVGAYGENANDVATDLPHGSLLEDGVFRRIDMPGAQRMQPFGIRPRVPVSTIIQP